MISVIMSVYNEENYIAESIESILGQTVSDFELIIIDDCSTDRTVEIIRAYNDSRIRLYVNDVNLGLTKNLNKALELCKGEYIARMDGDDICLPDRFAKQLEYMNKNPDVYLISCRMETFGNGVRRYTTPLIHEDIMDKMIIGAVMPHPGFFMRASLITDEGIRYDESFLCSQDYDFEARVASKHRLGMIKDYALRYRIHENQVSSNKREQQAQARNRVRRTLISYALDNEEVAVTDDEMTNLNILADREYSLEINWNVLNEFIRRYNKACIAKGRGTSKNILREYVLRLFHDRDMARLFSVNDNADIFAISSIFYFVDIFVVLVDKTVKKIFRIYEA